MTNPTAAIRMLITYVVCIPVAITVGYLLTDPLDYGTLGFLGLLIAILISPIFIKWHYPMLVFGLGCPIICFFIVGKPPFSQVIVVLSLGIALTERILNVNGEKRFLSVPAMTWPLLYICAVTYLTAELNGGIQLQHVGGEGAGGGRKYLNIFLGAAGYFALTSQAIPRARRKLYLMLFMLPSLLGLISDLFPYLPSPLNKINLLFPPTSLFEEGITVGTTRLSALSFAIGTVMYYMLARYGLRGIFSATKPWRGLFFVMAFLLSLLGGYRSSLGGLIAALTLIFFLEGMHRTRLLPLLLLAGVLGGTVLAVVSDKLPFTFQRSMCFLPLFKWDEAAVIDARNSSEWRYAIWRETWPKVPEHLLLGKGYTITAEEYSFMGNQIFDKGNINASDQGLAVSGDYHSGPLSTLMPFGIWGGIGMLWLMGAVFYVTYHNYRYGDPELKTMNTYFFAASISGPIFFLFVVGALTQSVTGFASLAGFSVALNGGMARPKPQPVVNPRIKPLPAGATQPA